MKTRLFHFFWIILGLSAVVFSFVSAQGGDCGNGLVQRLEVGGRGWIDPAPPAQGVRVRQEPGGTEVYRLQPGESFTVTGGPECFDTYSWWEIETDGGVIGWIAEGIEAGEYFVDPLPSGTGGGASSSEELQPVINNNPNCENPSQLEPGRFVEITVDENELELYYGHPLLEDGFYSYNQFMGIGADDEMVLQALFYGDGLFLTVDGPYCFNGKNLWQIAPVEPELIAILAYDDFNKPFFWIAEEDENGEILRLSRVEPPQNDLYQAQSTILSLEDSAPVLSPASQIAFGGGAGGGGAYSPFFVRESACDITAVNSTITNYSNACRLLYPFSADETVNVTIYAPDGSIYSQANLNTEPIRVSFETYPYLNFFDSMESSQIIQEVPSYGVRVNLPDEIGIAEGIWVIEAQSSEYSIRKAYAFDEWDSLSPETDRIPEIRPVCSGIVPQIALIGFEPSQSIELVLVEGNTDIIEDSSPFEETQRWRLQAGSRGELLLTHDFPMPEGLLIIADENGDWRNQVDAISRFENSLQGNTGYMTNHTCNVAGTENAARSHLLNYGENAIFSRDFEKENSSAYFAFEGTAGDIITIQAVSVDDDYVLDPRIELLAPSGETIASNDDALSPRYAPTDSELREIVLSETGIYIVQVSAIGENEGRLWLRLEAVSATNTSNDFVLNYGSLSSATLETAIDTWTFTGSANDIISITAQSGDFDIKIALLDEAGSILAEDDDNGDETDALISDFTLPTDGTYSIQVSTWGDKSGRYSIRISQVANTNGTQGQTETINVPVATTIPANTDNSSSNQPFCEGAPESFLGVGNTAVQALENDPIRVRAEPRSGTTVQYLLYPGEVVTIISGPECNALDDGNALIWWEIENSDGLRGWVAEGNNEQYFLEPEN